MRIRSRTGFRTFAVWLLLCLLPGLRSCLRRAAELSFFLVSVLSTAEEWHTWIETLEAEEHERLESLRARTSALGAEETPAPNHIRALLTSALQAQVTLMRMSRVFPDHSSSKLIDVTSALGHGPTVALACELRRCWAVLGVTGRTLETLLQRVVLAIGRVTHKARLELFTGLIPKMRRGVDFRARTGLAAEGSGQIRNVTDDEGRLPLIHSAFSVRL